MSRLSRGRIRKSVGGEAIGGADGRIFYRRSRGGRLLGLVGSY